ncbi:MAG TPA: thioredoxin family protein, partial [Candidatus Cloacimonadota bacterium]|nr:thioredoxin family protein [Candidatus Cloacimonadota bacterium]
FVEPQYSKGKQWVMTIIAVVVVVFGGYFLLQVKEADSVNSAEAAHADGLWKTFSEEAVYALIDEGKPVFVDFSAEWCMTCKTNETTVLWTKEIEDAFTNKGVTLFAGDYTRKDPIIHAWLKKFNKAGVPLYLLYIPGQNEPIVFPELITKGMILDKLSLIPDSIIEGEN